jgi:hypothetical protein
MAGNKATRKEMKTRYRENPPAAGVYRITNTATGQMLVGVSTNLAAVQNKLDFAKSTNLPGALDQRLRSDLEQHGVEAFAFEVLEVMEIQPGRTDRQIQFDLNVMEQRWREELALEWLY